MGDFLGAETMALDAYHKGDLFGDFRTLGAIENLLSNIYLMKGNIDKAIYFCDLSIGRDKYLENDIDSKVTFLLKGQILFEKNLYQEAESCYNKASKLFELASSKDYIYELHFAQLILELCKYQQGLSSISDIHTILNIRKDCGNRTEQIFNKIGLALTQDLINKSYPESLQLSDLLAELYDDLKEIPNFIHIVYYLCLLQLPLHKIGEKHVRRALDYCKQLSNKHRLELLTSYLNKHIA